MNQIAAIESKPQAESGIVDGAVPIDRESHAKPRRVMLRVNEAIKWYRDNQALAGMSFELYAGEMLGLLGPNGAGKTSLIRCVSGRSRLDSGKIEYGDETAGSKSLGVVPQELALYEDLTAEQNLKAFGTLQGVHASDLPQRVDEALHWAQLTDRRKHLVRTFSGGMQRRLNIACSTLHRPRVLLLDEPTVGVDPQSRERIYEMLAVLKQQNTAVLLTTHHLDEAQHRCDRIAIVDSGKVVMQGEFEQLIANTIGPDQQLKVQFAHEHSWVPKPFVLSRDGMQAICRFDAAQSSLADQLDLLERYELEVENVALQGPTLHHVFLHLTGKELRE